MVDVGSKPVGERLARASGRVRMRAETLQLILDKGLAKGDVLEVARLAGIMAAKKTHDLVPLCHALPLDGVEVAFEPLAPDCLRIEATARATARTGVEMEALVAVSVSALTVYDMTKAVDKGMVIEEILLEEKRGGRSGEYRRAAPG